MSCCLSIFEPLRPAISGSIVRDLADDLGDLGDLLGRVHLKYMNSVHQQSPIAPMRPPNTAPMIQSLRSGGGGSGTYAGGKYKVFYSMVNFTQNIHHRHPIAHPSGILPPAWTSWCVHCAVFTIKPVTWYRLPSPPFINSLSPKSVHVNMGREWRR